MLFLVGSARYRCAVCTNSLCVLLVTASWELCHRFGHSIKACCEWLIVPGGHSMQCVLFGELSMIRCPFGVCGFDVETANGSLSFARRGG